QIHDADSLTAKPAVHTREPILIYPRVLAALLLSGGMASVAVAAPPVMLNDALITQIHDADSLTAKPAVHTREPILIYPRVLAALLL
ncbi:hypothetical protein CTI14_65835, partial [Methylobacterium radiotolerans]